MTGSNRSITQRLLPENRSTSAVLGTLYRQFVRLLRRRRAKDCEFARLRVLHQHRYAYITWTLSTSLWSGPIVFTSGMPRISATRVPNR